MHACMLIEYDNGWDTYNNVILDMDVGVAAEQQAGDGQGEIGDR